MREGGLHTISGGSLPEHRRVLGTRTATFQYLGDTCTRASRYCYVHGRDCDQFIAFELGTMFAPFGKIYDLDTYRRLARRPQCIGAKHSSLSRELEWQRLQLRDRVRPGFKVLTGNDLAIDMVMYGSDYCSA